MVNLPKFIYDHGNPGTSDSLSKASGGDRDLEILSINEYLEEPIPFLCPCYFVQLHCLKRDHNEMFPGKSKP